MMNTFRDLRAPLRTVLVAVGIFCALTASAVKADDAVKERGKALFAEHCASCHGDKGQGINDAYAQPLTGDRSIKELSHYLHTSMPDGSPEDVQGDDAAAVAAYIYDAFYSPIAQVRVAPPQVLFSRLTARQMQHSIPDVINDRRIIEWLTDGRGASAEYYASKSRKNENRVAKLTDGTIDFKYPDTALVPAVFEEEGVSATWSAGLIAPETGHYTFRVESNGSFKLDVNSTTEEGLIDRRVKSGDETAFEATTYLVGGRIYPVRMEFAKVKKDDAFFRLMWTPPNGTTEVIPRRALVPGWFNYMPVITTPFPADDASTGYARGDAVSQEWAQAAAKAAVEASQIVVANANHLASINTRKDSPEERKHKLREYGLEVTRNAYRRPLTEDETAAIKAEFDKGDAPEAALQRVTLRALASPQFLYREINRGDFDDHSAASWISYAMWDSVPDKHMRAAAEKGELRTPEQFKKWASHAIGKNRAHAKLKDFFMTWLYTDRFHDMAKNGDLYPGFDKQAISDLHTSLELFVDDIVWGDNPDFRRLLRSRELYLNKNLADLYAGGEWDANRGEHEFAKVELAGEPRAGILSHPYLMAGFAHDKTSSPIHRGVFMSRNVLGRVLKVPTAAIAPLAPELQPDLTTRERVALQTDSTTCMSCHSLINPLGYAFEHFDAIGKYRDVENSKKVDASGVYLTSTGDEVKFDNLAELADWIAESDEARAAFVSHLFHYTIKQPIYAFGGIEYRDGLVERFKQNNHDIRKLWIDIVATSAEQMMKMNSDKSKVAQN